MIGEREFHGITLAHMYDRTRYVTIECPCGDYGIRKYANRYLAHRHVDLLDSAR